MSARTVADLRATLTLDTEGRADSLADAVRDVLFAIETGRLPDCRVGPPGDRAESAYVAALRARLAAFDALRIPIQQQEAA